MTKRMSDIDQIEAMEHLNSKQKTISMPDPANKLSTFEPKNNRYGIESVYGQRKTDKHASKAPPTTWGKKSSRV